MNVVDSSGWLEYFADGPNAGFFSEAIEDTERLIVATISVYEVFKRVLQQTDAGMALQAVTALQQAKLVDLTQPLAIRAAALSTELKLPMADSIILATARSFQATVWTQDSDFEDFEDVRYIPKKHH